MNAKALWFGLLVLCFSTICQPLSDIAARQTPTAIGEVVLLDDFDVPGTSVIQAEDSIWYSIAHDSGALRVENRTGGVLSFDLPPAARDGTIEIDARMVDPEPGHYVAIGCRGSLNTYDAGYTFVVGPYDGFIGLFRREQGSHIPLDTTYLNLADKRAGDTGVTLDRFALTCSGTTLTGKLNGVPVVSASDSHYAEGYYYVEFGQGDDGGIQDSVVATFDNLLIALSPEEVMRQRMQATEAGDALDDLIAHGASSMLVESEDGEIAYQGQAGVYHSYDVVTDIGDFYLTVRFSTRLDATTKPWDGLLRFGVRSDGSGYIVLVSSTGFWEVMGPDGAYLATGIIPSFNFTANSEITLEVAVSGSNLTLRIDGTVSAHIDLGLQYRSGGVEIGGGILPGNNRAGELIYYDGLKLISLVPGD